MQNRFLITCVILAATASSAGAATVTNILFSDDFDTETAGFNTILDNWTVTQGSVDVVNCGGSGRCVDIDGSRSGSLPTIMSTNLAFDYVAGRTYMLSIAIPRGTQADPITFTFGSVLGETYANYSFPLNDAISGIAGSNGSAPLEISLGSARNNNFGPYLTSISLTETYEDDIVDPSPIPLPAAAPALLGGIFMMGALRRRRRAS